MTPLLLLGLARPHVAEGPALGEGEQTVTVVVRGAHAQGQVEATREGVGTLLLADPGVGYLSGSFRAPPARFAQLRLVQVSGRRDEVFEGLVPLSGREHEVLSFEILPGALPRAVRAPFAPSADAELAVTPDAWWGVRFGWGALALGYATALALGAQRR